MADMVATLLKDMPPQVMLEADTLVSVLAVHVVLMCRGRRAVTPAMQLAHIIGMAAATGEVVSGEAITGIRPLDIRWAITAIPTVGTMVRTTDTILTATDTGRP